MSGKCSHKQYKLVLIQAIQMLIHHPRGLCVSKLPLCVIWRGLSAFFVECSQWADGSSQWQMHPEEEVLVGMCADYQSMQGASSKRRSRRLSSFFVEYRRTLLSGCCWTDGSSSQHHFSPSSSITHNTAKECQRYIHKVRTASIILVASILPILTLNQYADPAASFLLPPAYYSHTTHQTRK